VLQAGDSVFRAADDAFLVASSADFRSASLIAGDRGPGRQAARNQNLIRFVPKAFADRHSALKNLWCFFIRVIAPN